MVWGSHVQHCNWSREGYSVSNAYVSKFYYHQNPLNFQGILSDNLQVKIILTVLSQYSYCLFNFAFYCFSWDLQSMVE